MLIAAWSLFTLEMSYPEEFDWMGHWVVFDGEDRGYYCDLYVFFCRLLF